MEVSLYKGPQRLQNQLLRMFSLFCEIAMDDPVLPLVFQTLSLLSELVKNMQDPIQCCLLRLHVQNDVA